MEHYRNWLFMKNQLTAIAVYTSDRQCFFRQFELWGAEMGLPLYLWNAGYRYIQEIRSGQISPTPQIVEANILSTICEASKNGIFLVEGFVQNINFQKELQLRNTYDALSQSNKQIFIVLFDELLDIPMNLYPLVPQLEKPFPSSVELEAIITKFCETHSYLSESDPLPLLQACTGLPEGEILLILNNLVHGTNDIEELADSILEYAKQKLAGKSKD